VLWEIERNIPLPLEESYFTYKVVSRISEKGSPIWNVVAVVAKRDEVDRYLEAFRSMNIIVEEVSYLPINILSAINIEGSENAVGFVYISEHAIELYIIFQKKIVSFSHYIGDFKNITGVTVRNIVDYFAELIPRTIAFLERIVVIDKQGSTPDTLIESMMDSLNILTMPSDVNDFLPVIRKSKKPLEIYDLLGFAYEPFINLKIEPKAVHETHSQDVFYRIAIVIFIFLDVLTLLLMPMILAATAKYKLIQQAQTTPIEEVTDERVREMAELLKQIAVIEEYQRRQEELNNKIQQIKSLGIESSNLKLILVELCRLIPEDVWLKDLSIDNGAGVINGTAASSEGIENFVAYLVNSRVIRNVVLTKADMNGAGRAQVKFTVTFEVIK
jgi:Tfp pilus assembly protein PilN